MIPAFYANKKITWSERPSWTSVDDEMKIFKQSSFALMRIEDRTWTRAEDVFLKVFDIRQIWTGPRVRVTLHLERNADRFTWRGMQMSHGFFGVVASSNKRRFAY